MSAAIYATVARAQSDIDEQVYIYEQTLRKENDTDINTKVEAYRAALWSVEEKKHLERCRMVFRFNMAAVAQATAKHISIRPRDDFTDWPRFRAAIEHFVTSSLFSATVWSFEQKGETDADLGKGFHAHIVARPQPGRYNSHILRGLRQAGILGEMCGDAGCHIDTAKTPAQLIQGYLLDYVAPADDHKDATREWDMRWRARENLLQIYGNLTAFGVAPPAPLEPSP